MSEYQDAKARIQPILNELNQCEDSEEEAHDWAHKLDLLLQAADKEIAERYKNEAKWRLRAAQLEREKADAIATKDAELARLREALQRISDGTDAPDIDLSGDWQTGLYCGVEDRDCQDRYEGADYGYSQGVERTLEWAGNEADYALKEQQ